MKYKEIEIPRGFVVFSCANFPTRGGPVYSGYLTVSARALLSFFSSADKKTKQGTGMHGAAPPGLVKMCIDLITAHIGNTEGELDTDKLHEYFAMLTWAIRESGDAKDVIDHLSSGGGVSIRLVYIPEDGGPEQHGVEMEIGIDSLTVPEHNADKIAKGLEDARQLTPQLH